MKATICVLATALLLSPAAFADEGRGQAFYEPKELDSVQLDDGSVLSRISVSGFVVGSDANNPFNMVNQHCGGTSIMADGQTQPTAYGYCEGIDRDGDIFFISWKNSPDGDTWQLLGGTGKFDGISGGGTTTTSYTWPDGKYVIDWSGTWTMKK